LPTLKLIGYPNSDKKQLLSWEKEFLGLYVTEHPFSEFEDELKGFIKPIHEIKDAGEDEQTERAAVVTAGVVGSVTKIITAKGDPMLFVRLENAFAGIELLIFPKLYEEIGDKIAEEKIMIVTGQLSYKDADAKILVNNLWEINHENLTGIMTTVKSYEPPRFTKKNIIITYPKGSSHQLADQVKHLFRSFPGTNTIFLHVDAQIIKTNFKVKYCPNFEQKVQELLGKNAIRIK